MYHELSLQNQVPIVAIVGRPNVGKSTLFNCLTHSRKALVADFPGLTRDRQYGTCLLGKTPFVVIDTGGLEQEKGARVGAIEHLIEKQTELAVREAQVILFLVDAQDGLTHQDELIAKRLRKMNCASSIKEGVKKAFLVLNKTDGIAIDKVENDFYTLGFGKPIPIAASNRRGVNRLLKEISSVLPEAEKTEVIDENGIRLAIVGRPNVGKSTLVNRLLGEERVIVNDKAGTTRDSIFIPFKRRDEKYILIDTAGVRRRSRVNNMIEKFSIIKTMQAIAIANVVIVVMDAHEGITDQDIRIIGLVIEAGRGLIIVVNKWDELIEEQKQLVKKELDRKLDFAHFAKIHFISALHGSGVGLLFPSVHEVYNALIRSLKTPELNRLLAKAQARHAPPLVKGHRIKLRYVHVGGQNPPCLVVHGARVKQVPKHYERYLENYFRKAFCLVGVPMHFEWREEEKNAK